jgi:hypothetical protein
VANGFFRKDEFEYEAERDVYICPAGRELKPIRRGRLRDMQKVDYANAEAAAIVRSAHVAQTPAIVRSRVSKTRTLSTAWRRACVNARTYSHDAGKSSNIPLARSSNG